MKYLKVKNFFNNKNVINKFENARIYGAISTTPYNYIDFFVKNELITQKELTKILKNNNIFSLEYCGYSISGLTKEELIKNLFDIVEVNKNNTYCIFGSRFESNK